MSMATLERTPWVWGIVIVILISFLAMARTKSKLQMLSHKKASIPKSFGDALEAKLLGRVANKPLNATTWKLNWKLWFTGCSGR
jgi:hypothetical protein